MTNVRHQWSLVLILATSALLAGGCSEDRSTPTPTSTEGLSAEDTAAQDHGAAIPFSDAQIFIEFNSTANDAGIQVFLDAEDWKRVAIFDQRGRDLLEIETGGGMRELGLTELRFEGAEPDASEVFDAFPAGLYKFRGTTTDRQRLAATAILSHDLPAAPEFSPSEGELVDADDVEIEWGPIAGVDRYQVIVESDANGLVLEVSVSSSTTSLQIPPSFLVPNTEYKAEVLAIAPSGNRTITEGTFVTGP
jgi:hypothetical protein